MMKIAISHDEDSIIFFSNINKVYLLVIVEKNGISEDITSLYEELSGLGCVLQFVRSGRVAITKSNFERVNEYLDYREEKYRKQKQESND